MFNVIAWPSAGDSAPALPPVAPHVTLCSCLLTVEPTMGHVIASLWNAGPFYRWNLTTRQSPEQPERLLIVMNPLQDCAGEP